MAAPSFAMFEGWEPASISCSTGCGPRLLSGLRLGRPLGFAAICSLTWAYPTEANESTSFRNAFHYPSNLAVIEIFAFKTFETGHPFSAASAYF